MLCYLCGILRPEYNYHGQSVVFDPLCCTPADLYRLLCTREVFHCTWDQIHVLDEMQSEN